MDKCKILFLAANPQGTTPLALDKEIREIGAKIRASEHRDSLELVSRWAVRPDDLLQALLEVRPQIVHFSGHGTTDEIVLVGNDDQPKPVGKQALAYLFGTLKDKIRLVLLNACYSQVQAELITQHIDCVVGMNKPIGDAAAVVFAASFYRAIGFGRSVREAYEIGQAALMLEGIAEHGTPELLARDGVDPAKVFLVSDQAPKSAVVVMLADPVVSTRDGSGTSSEQAGRLTIPTSYTEWLKRQCSNIDVVGLRLKDDRRLRLNRVYVPLTTPSRLDGVEAVVAGRRGSGQDEPPPQLLLDLLDKQSLYVSGPPGSGKSTFSKWVAWLACEQELPSREIPEPEKYQEQFPSSFCGRFPLLVPLRDFWDSLPRRQVQQLTAAGLHKALEKWLEQTQPGGLRWSHVAAQLQHGTALIVFDGVDEVPLIHREGDTTWHPRTLLLTGISDAIAHWSESGNRVLVTSRPYGLDAGQRQRLGLPHAPIEDLAEPLQDLIMQRYFRIMADDVQDAQQLSKEMLSHMRERPGVRELARNPMLLTAMCVIYNEGKRLPHDKYDLYTRIVDNVLYNRFPDPTSRDRARNQLCVVAHAMHTGVGLNEDRRVPQAQVTCDEMERSLESYLETRRWVQSGFDDTLATREQLLSHSGLLLPSGDEKGSFYHFSIQEFLAAQRLWDQASEHERLVPLFCERAESAEWHNTLSFLFSTALGKCEDPERGIRLVHALIGRVNDKTLGLAVVIGDCLQILLGRGIRLEKDREESYRRECLSAIQREVPLRERRLLGLALGQIGDPRIIADLRDPAAYVEIPAGKYPIGDKDKESYGPFTPLPEQVYELDEPFLLSRYPVTNHQFAIFTKDGGYDDRTWWSDEGWRRRQEENWSEPRLSRHPDYDGPTQPVVGVSWYEAEAFCKWAGGFLPSELQWEAAARGPKGLVYPWGNDWEDGICNSEEAGLKVTSPVGLFPRSKSVDFGLEDMAGNVWEWCSDKHERYGRVLRGRSFVNDASGVRGASRNYFNARSRFHDFGFRVARTYR